MGSCAACVCQKDEHRLISQRTPAEFDLGHSTEVGDMGLRNLELIIVLETELW